MNQPDLFDSLPYVPGSATSKAAAESMQPKAGTLRWKVWKWIHWCATNGATDDECQKMLHMDPSTQRPRRIELEKVGLVIKTDRTRPTRSGRHAAVYVAKEYQ